MTPLGLFILGFLFTIVDAGINDFDLLPDVVGWLIVVLAMNQLRARHLAFTVAMVIAGLRFVFSVLVLLLPGTSLGEFNDLVGVLAETAVTFAICTAFIALLPDPRRRTQAQLLRWLTLGVTAVTIPVGWALTGAARETGDFNPPGDTAAALVLLLVALATIATVVWFLVLVWVSREEAELQPSS